MILTIKSMKHVKNKLWSIPMIIAIVLTLLIANFAAAETLNDQIIWRMDGDEYISTLIAQGAELNQIYADGSTPLTIASIFCRPKTAQLLLKAGADINKPDKFGPPLYHTVTGNCAILTKILIDNGANAKWVDKRNGNNLLHYASVLGADSEVYDLINAGADINGLDYDGESPLRALLNWPGVASWFKEERSKLYRRYGAKDVYTRPQSLPTQPTESQSKRRKNQPDEIKRDRERPSDHQIE